MWKLWERCFVLLELNSGMCCSNCGRSYLSGMSRCEIHVIVSSLRKKKPDTFSWVERKIYLEGVAHMLLVDMLFLHSPDSNIISAHSTRQMRWKMASSLHTPMKPSISIRVCILRQKKGRLVSGPATIALCSVKSQRFHTVGSGMFNSLLAVMADLQWLPVKLVGTRSTVCTLTSGCPDGFRLQLQTFSHPSSTHTYFKLWF